MSPAKENLDSVISDLIDDDNANGDQESANPFDGIDTNNKPIDGPPVGLTERAGRQVQKILQEQQSDETLYLRVAVEGGGCSGLSYKLGLDHITNEDDTVESQNIEIIVDSKHMIYLQGITIDYPNGLDARGFTFDNPNASETCGCGSSFAT